MQAETTGLDKLKRTCDHLAGMGSKAAVRAGMNKVMTPLVRALQAAVNASPASPAVKREARKTIGKRWGKPKGEHEMAARVGFGVGKKQKQTVLAKFKRIGKKGVGLSENDIHWFVLGTQERQTGGSMRKRAALKTISPGLQGKPMAAGKPTGKIEAVLGGLPALALATAGVMDAALAAARETIFREVKKGR